MTMASLWSSLSRGAEDPIIGISQACIRDPAPRKANLSVGAYRDDQGKPYVLPSVREAERRIYEDKVNHEYSRISGCDDFCRLSAALVFGENSDVYKNKRYATVQTISGTGAVRVGAEFLAKFATFKAAYLPSPSWPVHQPIFAKCGFEVKHYRYYDQAISSLNFDHMVEDVKNAPEGSLFVLHACAHNPTGADPTTQQWDQLAQIFVDKKHFAFFDMAYQGFASGDLDADAYAIRTFADKNIELLVAQSYAKNLGLYGERVGSLSFVCASSDEASIVLSNVNHIIRPMYSSPPINGARIVTKVLSSPELTAMWLEDLKVMSGRIKKMREDLVKYLKEAGSTRDWSHITSQIGMFAFTGLNPDQVALLAKEHHVYMTSNGRISVAGLNPDNVKWVAEAIHSVTSD